MKKRKLKEKFPPSAPCSCPVCLNFCLRPGWWSVEEATKALDTGYGNRMMLEMSPDKGFGVLSPAFKGCEGRPAAKLYEQQGCTFLKKGLCELYETGREPLECRFCHHDRKGMGAKCHAALEQDWDSDAGRLLVVRWGRETGMVDRLKEKRPIIKEEG